MNLSKARELVLDVVKLFAYVLILIWAFFVALPWLWRAFWTLH